MMPILARLDEKIAKATSPLAIAELRAEQVCYFARAGQFETSAQTIRDIRSNNLLCSSPRVMTWVMIAEGVLGYFRELDPRSRDRLFRAYGIARGAKLNDLERICASWMVHAEFNRCDYDSMAEYVRRYLNCGSYGADAAAGRIALVLADANLYAGEYSRSAGLYESARRIAVDIGDKATIGAIMHGRAALNSARARINEVLGVHEEDPLRFLRMEIETSESFHRATGQVALEHVTAAIKARVLQSEGRFREAIDIYKPIVEQEFSTSLVADTPLLKAEFAVCLLRDGQRESAAENLESILLVSSVELGRDDQVVFWSCIKELASSFSLDELANSAEANLGIAKDGYLQEQGALKAVLFEFEGQIP